MKITLCLLFLLGSACASRTDADEWLFLNQGQQPQAQSQPGTASRYDSDGAVRYVCYDTRGTIETIITQQGHDALIPSCPAGDTALASDAGDIGDRVSAGRVESAGE